MQQEGREYENVDVVSDTPSNKSKKSNHFGQPASRLATTSSCHAEENTAATNERHPLLAGWRSSSTPANSQPPTGRPNQNSTQCKWSERRNRQQEEEGNKHKAKKTSSVYYIYIFNGEEQYVDRAAAYRPCHRVSGKQQETRVSRLTANSRLAATQS
jgi:cytochrome c553